MPQEYRIGDEELEELYLPEGVTEIGAAAFAACAKLRRVRLPSTLRRIGSGAFSECAGLQEICFPSGLEEIQELAFEDCDLRQVILPESVTAVGEHAFWGNEHLVRADVLNPRTRLGKDVFGSCYHLTQGYIAPGYPPDEVVDPSPFCQAERGAGNLLYTLLWCSCPERHDARIARRAEDFIREHQNLMMEWILRENNTAAMTTIARRRLLDPETVDGYVEQALQRHCPELTALLLDCRDRERSHEDFEL